MLRRISSIVLAVLAAAGITLAVSPQASAATTNRFQLVGTNQCLDGYITRPGNDLYLNSCNAGNYQKWRWSAGETQLVNLAGPNCAIRAGNAVNLAACNSTALAQKWLVSGSLIKLSTVQSLCIGRTGPGSVGLVTCNAGSVYQQWRRV